MSFEEMNPLHSNGVHLMLVDYDPNSLSKSTSVLRQASFKVTPTKVQQAALTLLRENKEQFNMLIVSDQNEEMDCHSFIQRIRIIQEDLPIIVISSLGGDQGLKTVFGSWCYVIRKPVTDGTIRGVWQQHEMRTGLAPRRQVIEESEASGGNGSAGQAENAPRDPKGKAVQGDENRRLKRSKPCEDEEQEVAKKKGKSIAEPRKTDEQETTKRLRPTFDPQQHKLLMEALSYGPARHMNTAQFLPTMGQQQVPTMTERYGRARAPWTQYLNERLEKVMARNSTQGYGVQQPHLRQRFPPSWVSPTNWRAHLNSEFLNSRANETMGGIPMSGLNHNYGASTSINSGLNVAEYQMPVNPNMVNFNGVGSSLPNGTVQSMNQVGTQPNPIPLDGFNNGAQDGMRFGSYGYDNSLLSVVYPGKGNTQMEKQVNESIGYGQNFDSRFGYPTPNLGPFPGVDENFFQSTNNVLLSTDLQTTAYNAAEVEVEEIVNLNEENVVTWQDLGATPTNQVETLVNEPNIQGSEGGDRAENLNSDFDEFAAMFSFLQNDADDGRTNPGSDKANEVEGDSFFDIESFELSCGDFQI